MSACNKTHGPLVKCRECDAYAWNAAIGRETQGFQPAPQPDPKQYPLSSGARAAFEHGYAEGAKNSAPQPDPKDARIAELERIAEHLKETLHEVGDTHAQVVSERDAYKRAKEENDERYMIERDEARAERDAARAECETLKKNLADAQSDCAAEVEACRRLEAEAARKGRREKS